MSDKILHGHTSPETAYVIGDYPYGRTLRCKIRYWIETKEKGADKGRQRLVTQTTNPKVPGEVWNKPKKSTYSLIKVLFIEGETGHVKSASLNLGSSREYRQEFHQKWGDQLSPEQLKQLERIEALIKNLNSMKWKITASEPIEIF